MHRSTVLIKFTFCKLGKKEYMYHVIGLLPVPEPDLEIRRGWGKGRLVSKRNYSALQFGLKIRGLGGGLPVPLPWIPH